MAATAADRNQVGVQKWAPEAVRWNDLLDPI